MSSKIFIALLAIASAAPFREDSHRTGLLEKRLDNGLGKTPALGWNGWVRLPIISHYLSLSLHITNQ